MPEIPDISIPNLSDTQKVLTMLRDGLIAHDTRIQDMRNDVNDIKKDISTMNEILITGNGKGELPLREIVRNHEAIISEWRGWIKLFIGLMITQAVAVIGGLIVAYIRFLPILEKLAKQP